MTASRTFGNRWVCKSGTELTDFYCVAARVFVDVSVSSDTVFIIRVYVIDVPLENTM